MRRGLRLELTENHANGSLAQAVVYAACSVKAIMEPAQQSRRLVAVAKLPLKEEDSHD